MKNIWKFVIAVLIVLVVVLLISRTTNNQNYFNEVQLDSSNYIGNNVNKPYIDTILNVGLSILNLKNVTIFVSPLSENTKLMFASEGGELKAHIREYNGNYYIFIDDVDRLESIEILSHELVHLKQYHDGRLMLKDKTPIWLGEEFPLTLVSYDNRPWEIEAYMVDDVLESKIKNVLYNK